jgi:hypothetical protein
VVGFISPLRKLYPAFITLPDGDIPPAENQKGIENHKNEESHIAMGFFLVIQLIASMWHIYYLFQSFKNGNSPIYIGEINEAIPIASPLIILPAINQERDGAKAVPMALMVKIMPASIIILRRP